MCAINWTDCTIAICTIISTIATALGAFFVVIQIRNGTKAQQDKKAPLLVLEMENDSIAGIKIKNVGELSAIIVKLSVRIFSANRSWDKKEITQQIVIEKDVPQELFSLSNELGTNTDKVTRVIVAIKYKSPLNDRMRKCNAEFVRS